MTGSGLEVIIRYGGRKAHEVVSSSTPTLEFKILKRDLTYLRAHAPSQKNVRRVHASFILHWPMAEMSTKVSGPPDSLYSRWIKLCSDDLATSNLRQFLSIESITVTQDGYLLCSTPPSKHASQTVSPGTLATQSTLEQSPSALLVPPLGPPQFIPQSPGAVRQPTTDSISQSSSLKRRLSNPDDPTSPAATRQKKNHLRLTHPTLPPKPIRPPTQAGSSTRAALKAPSRGGTPVNLARTPTQSRRSSEARTVPPSPASLRVPIPIPIPAPVMGPAQSVGFPSLAPQPAHAPPTLPLSFAQPPPAAHVPPPAARAPSPVAHVPPPATSVPPLSTRPVPGALLPTARLPPAPSLSSFPRLSSPPPFDPPHRPFDLPPHLVHAPRSPPDAAPAPALAPPQSHSPPPDTQPDDATTRRERVHQLMHRELEVVRRQLAVIRAEETRLLDKFDKAGVPVPEDAREEVARLEAELVTERARRERAERALEDVERECRQPFVVPALFQAFMRIADVLH